MTDYRAHFDAEIAFANGGGLSARGFRLDVPHEHLSSVDIGRLLVEHLGLALVSSVTITNLTVLRERHKGSRGAAAAPAPAPGGARRVVDLSHTIAAGLVTYPGLPEPTISSYLTRADSRAKYAAGTEFAMDIITMIGNTGTYLDSPFHRYDGGDDLADLPIETLVDLPAEVFHLDDSVSRGIGPEVFYDRELRGSAVLLHTGWDRWFGLPEYAAGAPFLTEAGAHRLVAAGVVLVGIDSLNIDDTESSVAERPAHSILLAAGVHVVEHLTALGDVPARGARFSAAPPKVRDFGTFPVRAYAVIG